MRTPVLLLLLFPAAFWAQDPPEYQEAIKLVQTQRWDEALSQIVKLTAKYPRNPKVRNLEGLALIGKGDAAKAITSFEQALAENPNFSPALKNLAMLEWRTGRQQRGEQHTVEALRLIPHDPVLNAYGALAALRAKDTAAAKIRLGIAGEALATLPPELEADLAVLLGTQGLYAEAIRVNQDCLKRGFDSPALRYNLGLAQFLAGDYPSAIRTLEEVRSRRASSDTLNLLAQAYDKTQQTQKAIDALRAASLLDPMDENNYLDLANLCLDHGAYPLGIEVVQVGLKYKPQSARLLFQLGLLYALSGDFPKAETQFERAGQFTPASALPTAALDLAAIQQSRLGAAIDDLRRKLEQQNDSAVLWYLLGAALVRSGAEQGTSREAITAFQNAVRLDPKLSYAYVELGKIYVRLKRTKEAVPLFERATQLAPSERAPYYQLAKAYRELGDDARARQMLATVKELNQKDRENVFRHEVLAKP